MEVIGTIEVQDAPAHVEAVHVSPDGTATAATNAVQEESLLDVYVNDILTMRLGCSANHLVELTVGRLFTEGMVAGVDDIAYLSVCESSMRAYVYLKDRKADFSRTDVAVTPTCCTNNRVLNDFFGGAGKPHDVTPIPWTTGEVFKLAQAFALDKTAHARTKGSHSAYLARGGEVLCVRDDIGRHNAVDKVIGWALCQELDLGACALFTSGRVPTDMAVKVVRAGIPLLLSKTVATDRTVELARTYKLTLLTSVTPRGFDVINDPLGVVMPTPASSDADAAADKAPRAGKGAA